jgi:hypothetical protein
MLEFPRTNAVTSALEIVTEYAVPSLLEHAKRSYLFGVTYARMRSIGFDDELYCVAALLHDLGLEPPFDNTSDPFEESGGHVARVFAAGLGWPRARRDKMAGVIVVHMRDDVLPEDDPEGHMLQVATSMDISGANASWWPDSLEAEILALAPRGQLNSDFLACFRSQAERKPGSAAAAVLRGGLEQRMRDNPLERRATPAP